MAGQEPEERVRIGAMQQRWRDVLFVHWPYPPEVVARLLPPGLEPDCCNGSAWVSLTPFRVEAFRPGMLPPVPRLSSYPETNLRTYVTGPSGVDGLWFLTLEVDSVTTAIAGRALGWVPYRWADMEVSEQTSPTGVMIRYRSRRRGADGAGHDIEAVPGPPLPQATALDHWLTGRWRSWTSIAGRLATVPVQHQQWPLRQVEVPRLEETLVAAAGLPAPAAPPIAHFSDGVDARLGPPRPLLRGP